MPCMSSQELSVCAHVVQQSTFPSGAKTKFRNISPLRVLCADSSLCPAHARPHPCRWSRCVLSTRSQQSCSSTSRQSRRPRRGCATHHVCWCLQTGSRCVLLLLPQQRGQGWPRVHPSATPVPVFGSLWLRLQLQAAGCCSLDRPAYMCHTYGMRTKLGDTVVER